MGGLRGSGAHQLVEIELRLSNEWPDRVLALHALRWTQTAKGGWVSKLHTKPNATAQDQTMAQWTTEYHRSEIGMPREARELTDVNESGVNLSRERA